MKNLTLCLNFKTCKNKSKCKRVVTQKSTNFKMHGREYANFFKVGIGCKFYLEKEKPRLKWYEKIEEEFYGEI